ncbi:unnamed protein product [Rangifer tarandus platyrhynchus]|uniref:Uncharacterized protein n=2 Tax=Rangifer tarandus platyrhynchus TaxID=3082113 RepID=A0ACB0EP12_RANTA|nr:unnamed protein product [Rangifer tarandus platyrhynchus]CAI9702450.1 unnamed protein product [Rangifer tarandus platyrhynchus]
MYCFPGLPSSSAADERLQQQTCLLSDAGGSAGTKVSAGPLSLREPRRRAPSQRLCGPPFACGHQGAIYRQRARTQPRPSGSASPLRRGLGSRESKRLCDQNQTTHESRHTGLGLRSTALRERVSPSEGAWKPRIQAAVRPEPDYSRVQTHRTGLTEYAVHRSVPPGRIESQKKIPADAL